MDAAVPAADITLPDGETTALVVRLPGSDDKARPILFVRLLKALPAVRRALSSQHSGGWAATRFIEGVCRNAELLAKRFPPTTLPHRFFAMIFCVVGL